MCDLISGLISFDTKWQRYLIANRTAGVAIGHMRYAFDTAIHPLVVAMGVDRVKDGLFYRESRLNAIYGGFFKQH